MGEIKVEIKGNTDLGIHSSFWYNFFCTCVHNFYLGTNFLFGHYTYQTLHCRGYGSCCCHGDWIGCAFDAG